MRNYIIIFAFVLFFSFENVNSQTTCSEIIEYVKSNSYGTTYYSFNSEAISQVTFYEIRDNNFKTYYFAIVKFTSSYQEYIYQVSSNTKFNYSMHYSESAGKAFWKYIQPFNEILNCAPKLD